MYCIAGLKTHQAWLFSAHRRKIDPPLAVALTQLQELNTSDNQFTICTKGNSASTEWQWKSMGLRLNPLNVVKRMGIFLLPLTDVNGFLLWFPRFLTRRPVLSWIQRCAQYRMSGGNAQQGRKRLAPRGVSLGKGTHTHVDTHADLRHNGDFLCLQSFEPTCFGF